MTSQYAVTVGKIEPLAKAVSHQVCLFINVTLGVNNLLPKKKKEISDSLKIVTGVTFKVLRYFLKRKAYNCVKVMELQQRLIRCLCKPKLHE